MDFAELMALTDRIVRRSARRARWGRDDIDDLIQTVLMKYLQTWRDTDGPDNPAAWLQRATSNAMIDQLRANRRRPADPFAPNGDDPLSNLIATLRAAGGPSRIVMNDAIWQDALALVPKRDAELLQRRFMDRVPAADLAAELNVSRNVIDQRTARAKKRIQAALAQRPDLITALKTGHQHAYHSDHRFR